MELNHLRYFFEVARAGSFTAAAKALRVSQPSLSKIVALLEAREGVSLLERSKKGVALTEVGAQVYLGCEKIFGTLGEIKNYCQRTKTVCEGPLKLGASDHVANYLILDLLVEIKKSYPNLVPSVFTGTPNEIVEKLRKRELEFGLFLTRVEASDISYEESVGVPVVAVYKKIAAGRPSGYIGSILNDYKKNPAQWALAALEKRPEIFFESNNQELQKRLCLAGSGIAVFARFMVEAELKKGLLAEIPLKKKQATPLLIAKRSNHAYSLGAQKFLARLRTKHLA